MKETIIAHESGATVVQLLGKWIYLREGDTAILRLFGKWNLLREGNCWIVKIWKLQLGGIGWKMRFC